jgi:sulfite reductase alpha subunit
MAQFCKRNQKAAQGKEAAGDLLGQLELSYQEKLCHWKHGGIVGVRGYGAGVIGRYSDRPEEFPAIKEFHTMRINQPSGWFYTSDALRQVADIWDKYGSGLTNFHGATGDIILLGTSTENLQPCFDELSEAHFDLGGSGSALRTPSCCVGPARCEHACIDTLDICNAITQAFQNEMHRPAWPYKFKIKVSGCANDCVASIARSDLAIIGTWKDEVQVKQEQVREYAHEGMNIEDEVVRMCPTRACSWDNAREELTIHNEDCVRCMHCINTMPRALRVGRDRGASLMIGGKAPILRSAFLGWVLVPFMKLEPPYSELLDLIARIFDWWDENARTRRESGTDLPPGHEKAAR